MKRLFFCVICVFCVTLTTSAQKFALVDMEYILKNIPAYERANEQLNQTSKQWQAEVDALTTEAQTLYKNYQNEVVFLSTNGRDNKKITAVPLDITSKASVLGWRFAHSNENTILVETKDQVFKKDQFKKNCDRLELRVKITHPLSRITKVFVREFTMNDIHYGEFINHRLIRKSKKTGHKIQRELPKIICWRIAELLKNIEFSILLLLLITMGWYVSFTPSNEIIICVASYCFYIAVLTTSIMEIVRQVMQRPMTCKLCESSI